jgi:hypothetical protein
MVEEEEAVEGVGVPDVFSLWGEEVASVAWAQVYLSASYQ